MAARKQKAEKLKARVTHLEMLAAPVRREAMPLGHKLALMRTRDMPPAFYSYLYEQVGKPHHWLLRRHATDSELRAITGSAAVEIWVLYCEGSPGGFFELDLSRLPDEAEIVYFGLTPGHQGRGLARFMLSEAVFAAFAHKPSRLVIHTNTLDSPKALRLYQRMGFAPYAFSEEEIEPWV